MPMIFIFWGFCIGSDQQNQWKNCGGLRESSVSRAIRWTNAGECRWATDLPLESILSIFVAEAYFDDSGLPAPCPGPSPHVSKMSTIYCLKTRTFRCLLPSHVYLLKGTLHRRVQLDEYPPGKTFDAQVDQCSASRQHAI